MNISREIGRVNSVEMLLKMLAHDLEEYKNKEKKDDFGSISSLNAAVECLENATEGMTEMVKNE